MEPEQKKMNYSATECVDIYLVYVVMCTKHMHIFCLIAYEMHYKVLVQGLVSKSNQKQLKTVCYFKKLFKKLHSSSFYCLINFFKFLGGFSSTDFYVYF